jgi:hypothetical protein
MEGRTGQTKTILTGETGCLAYGRLGYGIVIDFALTRFCERFEENTCAMDISWENFT